MVTVDKTNNCYDDIPIIFKLKNESVNGFLTKSYVIVRFSKIVECPKLKNYSFIVDEILITRNKNEVPVESQK